MSCSDVMYQYYPYLYQTHRPPPPHPTHPHAAPHSHPHANPHAAHHSPARPAPFQPFPAATTTHQYDRLNVHQRSLETAGIELCGAGGSVPQGQPSSAGSVGSAPSPASPRPTPQPRPPLATTTTSQPSRTLDDDRSTDGVGAGTATEDSDDGESRAQYVNANCVVFTHYRGDAASEVEEHFQRALAHDKLKGRCTSTTTIIWRRRRATGVFFWVVHAASDITRLTTRRITRTPRRPTRSGRRRRRRSPSSMHPRRRLILTATTHPSPDSSPRCRTPRTSTGSRIECWRSAGGVRLS
ncbi:protein vestigial isoform X3 [Odontomachus brunneus]|uniref:protein vestigial isoform X3 n=1 Tax=Odontomachus brunneus TaxID=486640 RepID=UPI0013F1EEEC|nr:protein vestigial isoform X3 [Odontomachus brunneus]